MGIGKEEKDSDLDTARLLMAYSKFKLSLGMTMKTPTQAKWFVQSNTLLKSANLAKFRGILWGASLLN